MKYLEASDIKFKVSDFQSFFKAKVGITFTN